MQPSSNPRGAYLELQDKDAVFFQQPARGFQCLKGVDIVIDSNGRIIGNVGVRIEKGINNQIESLLAVLDVAPCVVDDGSDTRGGIRPLEMGFPPEMLDKRIDFDSHHVSRSVAKRSGDVVAHSGT